MDFVGASVASVALMFAGWLSVGIRPVTPILAQIVGIPVSPSAESIVDFALRQGGAFAILVIVLYFYRKDYRDLNDYRKGRDELLVGLVRDQTKAQTEMAAALRENNIIVHQAKNVLREHLKS